MTHKEEIEQLLIKGDLTKAIEELLIGTKANGQTRLHNDLILQSARNNSNEADSGRGILSSDDYKREKARINYAVQSYLGDYLPLADMHVNNDIANLIPVQSKPEQAGIPDNKIFISYSSNDRDLRQVFEQRLKVYLASAKNKFDTEWSDIQIPVGSDWNYEIQEALKQSNIGILLVSAFFLGSKYCMGDEFRQMLERRKSEGYTIVPILLRKCNFQNMDELKSIQFVKTYQSEYDVTDLLSKNELMPFDELVDVDKPNERLLNKYFLKVTDAIDKAIISSKLHL